MARSLFSPGVLTSMACASCLVAAFNSAAADQVARDSADAPRYDLRYRLATGDVLRYKVEHRASVRSTIDDHTQSAQTRTDSVKLWKITDVLPNGDIEFMNVVERVHMVNQLPERDPVEYDSERDKTPPPGFDDTARAIGVPLSLVRITPRGKVISRKVKHRQPNAEDDGAVVIRLPHEPVAVGATWDEPLEVTVQLEGGGTKVIQTRRHYKLTGVAGDHATIEATYQVLSPINSFIESQLVQRLMSGTVKFDIARGRVLGQQMDVDKRVLGFAGATSSMQYVMRMQEKLLEAPPQVASKPENKPAPPAETRGPDAADATPAGTGATTPPPSVPSAGERPSRSMQPQRSTNRRSGQSPSRSYRR